MQKVQVEKLLANSFAQDGKSFPSPQTLVSNAGGTNTKPPAANQSPSS